MGTGGVKIKTLRAPSNLSRNAATKDYAACTACMAFTQIPVELVDTACPGNVQCAMCNVLRHWSLCRVALHNAALPVS